MKYILTPRINHIRSKARELIPVLEQAQARELVQVQELLKPFNKALDLEQACKMLTAKELSEELMLVLEQAKIQAKNLVRDLTQDIEQMQATDPVLDHDLSKTQDIDQAKVLLKQAHELLKAKKLAEKLVEDLEDMRWSEWINEAAKQRRS